MQLAVYEESDELLRYLIVRAAQRRGHIAKYLERLDEAGNLFATPPSTVVLGVSSLSETLMGDLRSIRAACPDALIYVATANVLPRGIMAAFEAGATDVVRKPLLPSDLILRAEWRWANDLPPAAPDSKFALADLELDLDHVIARKAGRELILTRMEFRLICCLAEHHGRVASTDRLLTFATEGDDYSVSSLKTHMSHLRQKLSEAGGTPLAIKARHRLGYVLESA